MIFRRNNTPVQQEDASKIQLAMAPTKASWWDTLGQLFHSPELPPDAWDNLEEALIAADVGVGTSEELLERVRQRMQHATTSAELRSALAAEMTAMLPPPAASSATQPHPYVLLVVGVNGSGKTTTIGKLANLYRAQGKKVLLAAADTFRAAAIEQLQLWGQRVGAEVIAHQPGADPGAVAFDALQAAQSRNADVVIIDTAGRLQTKVNLMEELRKVQRVIQRVDPSAPHDVLLVLDATTGQNGLSQAHNFTDVVGITGVVLTKLDGTAKGGIVFAIAAETGLPVVCVGTGEGIDDLTPFDANAFVSGLLS